MLNKEELEEELQQKSANYETIIKFAPAILLTAIVFVQFNFFVTPEKLEIKHREILQEISDTYATKEQSNDLKNQLSDMQKKIDRIYDYVVKTR